ncbi:MAG: hypothetical protein J0I84_08925 [Terrimonas sp.]|nr:hypothetical protein [Terrimonas sp.]OJY88692.1 MAG: hypothetical protein BGP13_17465 [Sphingobacteriales bacterium 40-81]
MTDLNIITRQLNKEKNELAVLQSKEKDMLLKKKSQQDNIRQLEASLKTASVKDKPAANKEIARAKLALKKTEASLSINIQAQKAKEESIKKINDLSEYIKEIESLPASIPALLMPVRLETRYFLNIPQPELRIRVYPDTCSVETNCDYLTLAELDSIFTILSAPGSNAVNKWDAMADDVEKNHGKQRAAFLQSFVLNAKYYKLLGDINNKRTGAKYTISELQKIGQKTLSEIGITMVQNAPAPSVNTLPERFIFRLYKTDTDFTDYIGKKIQQPLAVSLMPTINEANGKTPEELQKDAAEDIQWLTDFKKAEALGMATTIALKAGSADYSFKKIVVFGLMTNQEASNVQSTETNLAEASQRRLNRLFRNHTFSLKGLSLIAQGTPTNNENENKDAPYIVPNQAPLLYKKDIDWLQFYLGLSADATNGIGNKNTTDIEDAIQMNKALFPTTIGYFLNEMLYPLVGTATTEAVEAFFSYYVLGRGQIPAIRIGKQPYGILPVSILKDFKPTAVTAPQSQVLDKVKKLDHLWKSRVAEVDKVGKTGLTREQFFKIVMLNASSVSFYQRILVDRKEDENIIANSIAGSFDSILNWLDPQSEDLVKALKNVDIRFGAYRPDILNKRFESTSTKLYGPLIEEQKYNGTVLPEAFSETELLKRNYLTKLATESIDTVRLENFSGIFNQDGVRYRKPLLYLLLRHSILAKAAYDAIKKETANKPGENSVLPAAYLDNQVTIEAAHSKTALLYRNDPSAKRINQNLLYLASLPTARLERAMTEHLDCCTYRLDAWVQGLYALQLEKMRNSSTTRTGIYLGAYGYVENVKPAAPGTTGNGYLLAPSLAHATAGTILKSAQLSYRENATNPYNINISSQRTRLAIALLEGIRNGQGLPDLLGYRIERGLHDASLDQYILPLRKAYPLIKPVLEDEVGSTAFIDAQNVVNGLAVLDAYYAKSIKISGNADTEKEIDITQEIQNVIREAEHIFDALKDLILIEATYQGCKGNHDRAAAVMDAFNSGKCPPELECIRTPRTGVQLTHKLAIHFPYIENENYLPGSSIRKMLEPSVNAWLRNILPPAGNVQIALYFTRDSEPFYISQADLAIEPIDMLYLLNQQEQYAATKLEDIIISYIVRRDDLRERYQQYLLKKTEDADNVTQLISYGNCLHGNYSFYETRAILKPLQQLLLNAKPVSPEDFIMPHKVEDVQESDIKKEGNTAFAARLDNVKKWLDNYIRLADNYSNQRKLDIVTSLAGTIFPGNNICFKPLIDSLLLENNAALKTPDEADRLRSAINDQLSDLRNKTEEITKRKIDVKDYQNFLALIKEYFSDDILNIPACIFDKNIDNKKLAEINQSRKSLAADTGKWLNGLARVRKEASALEQVIQFYQLAKGIKMPLLPVQTPYQDGDKWLGDSLHVTDTNRIKDRLLYTYLNIPGYEQAIGNTVCGIIVDEWTELIPSKEETAGLGFHYNKPNAEAPQTMLLAISPDTAGNWKFENMMGCIESAFEMTKIRCVTPDLLDDTFINNLLPATILFCPISDTAPETNLGKNNQ